MTAPLPPRSLSVVLAEDEPLVREYLRDLVDERDGLSVVAVVSSGPQAVAAVREHRPDILLLDVEMPGSTGVEALRALGDEAPPVVFVTAYSQYTLEAFDLHAVDYVLKPVDEDRLCQALDRAADRVRQGGLRQTNRRLLDLLLDLGVEPEEAGVLDPAEAPVERLSVPARGGWVLVDAADIDWIGGAGVYVEVHVGARRYLLRETLRALGDRLPTPPFARVHRSAIVNTERIRSVESLAHGDYLVHLADDTPIRVSRRYRDAIAALVRNSH